MEYSKSLQSRLSLSFKVLALSLLIMVAAMPTAGAVNSGGVSAPNSGSGNTSGVNNNQPANGGTSKTEDNTKKTPKTYEECVAAYQNVSLGKLQAAMTKAANNQVKRLDTLTTKVNASSLTEDQKTTVTTSMANDSKFIAAIPSATKNVTDVKAMKEAYCKVHFYGPLRVQQVRSLLIVSNYIKRDTNFSTRLNKPYNMNYKGNLKAEINQRTENARNLMKGNLAFENALATALAGASVDASNAAKVQAPDTSVFKTNFKNAYNDYTESWILKKAAQGYQKDSNIQLVSVTLLDKDGKETTDHVRSVTKAKVVLKVNNKQYTKNLERKDVNSVWKISAPAPDSTSQDNKE